MKKTFYLICLLLTVTVNAVALDKVVLQLRWDHQFQFAGYYAAEMMGYYEEAGLQVEIRGALDSGEKLKQATTEVSSGRADFGIGAADVIIAREQGADLKVVASVFQRSASRFYLLKKNGPVTLHELAQKLRVARVVNGLVDVEFQAMLRSEEIDPTLVKPYRFEPGLDYFIAGEVDVIPGYLLGFPFDATKKKISYLSINPSHYGIDFCGDSIFTQGDLIRKKPQLVGNFVTASMRGWRYALQHPQEVIDYIEKNYQRVFHRDDLTNFNRFQAEQLPSLMEADILEPGYINPIRWRTMHKALTDAGLVNSSFDDLNMLWSPEEELPKIQQDKLFSFLSLALLVLAITLGALIALFILKEKHKRNLQKNLAEYQKLYEKLRRTTEWHKTFNEAAMSGIWAIDFNENIKEVNTRYSLMIGYSVDELTSMKISDVEAQKSEREIYALIEQTISENEVHFETKHRRKDGGVIDVEINAKHVPEEEIIVVFINDITSRKNNESQLLKQKAALEKSQDIGKIGTWELSLHDNKIVWTKQNYQIFGVPIGTPVDYAMFLEIVHPDDRDHVQQHWQAAIAGQPYDIEHRILVGEEIRWVREKADLQLNNEGQAIGAIGVTQDITDIKLLQEEQVRSSQLAILGTVAAGVAHEINNPIQGIMNYAQLLKHRAEENEGVSDFARKIILESERIAKITKDLLYYSKDTRQELKSVDMKETIKSALSLIGTKTRQKGVDISLNVQPDLGEIVVQPQSIQQVIINLVDNAAAAIGMKEPPPDDKVISIDVKRLDTESGPFIQLDIEDNGVGMSPAVIQKAQDAFFTTKSSTDGTGLGLSIVKDIVLNHQGQLEIDSQEGLYTKIRIRLPVRKKDFTP